MDDNRPKGHFINKGIQVPSLIEGGNVMNLDLSFTGDYGVSNHPMVEVNKL